LKHSKTVLLFVALLFVRVTFAAEPSDSLSRFPAAGTMGAGSAVNNPSARNSAPLDYRPFSRVAFGVGISPLGIQLQAATNVNRYMNLRGTGNIFRYSPSTISTNGFDVDAKMNLSSTGASLDLYPFPKHGFRLSPGVLYYNANEVNGVFTAQGGTSFSLNNDTYYSSSGNPVRGFASVGLHSQKPAFTMTTGWGNMIPRRSGHFSFPFEVGVAFIGSPDVNFALTSGEVCDGAGLNCVDVATDPTIQSDVQAQVAKYRNDLDLLKTYPIVSFGVAYSFHVGPNFAR
jgi:hypothetical protein